MLWFWGFFFFQWWLEEWTFFLNKDVCFFFFFKSLPCLFILGQQCTMLLYGLFCYREVAFQRTRLEELLGASGVAISANRPQVESLSQGISFPSVPVNGSSGSPAEAPFPYVLISPLSHLCCHDSTSSSVTLEFARAQETWIPNVLKQGF